MVYGILYKLLLPFNISSGVEKIFGTHSCVIHDKLIYICGGHSDSDLRKGHTISIQI